VVPNDFETDDLPGPEDHADEIKAEIMHRLEARFAPSAPPLEGKEPPKLGDRKRT
jgi:hypothetical protein